MANNNKQNFNNKQKQRNQDKRVERDNRMHFEFTLEEAGTIKMDIYPSQLKEICDLFEVPYAKAIMLLTNTVDKLG